MDRDVSRFRYCAFVSECTECCSARIWFWSWGWMLEAGVTERSAGLRTASSSLLCLQMFPSQCELLFWSGTHNRNCTGMLLCVRALGVFIASVSQNGSCLETRYAKSLRACKDGNLSAMSHYVANTHSVYLYVTLWWIRPLILPPLHVVFYIKQNVPLL